MVAHQIEQEGVVLVGVGNGRVDDDRSVSQLVAPAKLALRRDLPGQGRLDAVGHDHHPGLIDSVGADHRLPHVVARHSHDLGPAHRAGNDIFQVGALGAREVLGVGEELEIVNGEHVRAVGAQWCCAAPVVHQRQVVGVLAQPRRLTHDATQPTTAVEARLDRGQGRGERRMGLSQASGHHQRRSPLGLGLLGEPKQLAHEVFLRAAHPTRHAPQQVHQYSRQAHPASSR